MGLLFVVKIAAVFLVTIFWSAAVEGQYRPIRPQLVTNPSNSVVHCKEGREMVVTCRDASNGHYDVTWERQDGQPIPSDAVVKGGDLCFPRVQPHDAGQYVCRATSYPRQTSRRCRRQVTVLVDHAGNQVCGTGQWCCGNGQCVDENCRCDGNRDCEDGTDESCLPEPPGMRCEWTRWTRCKEDCKQYRRQICYDEGLNDGVQQRPIYRQVIHRECRGDRCVVPSKVTCEWSEWSECSVACGPGIRTRHCLPSHSPMAQHYRRRNMNPEVTYCQIKPCPIDGGWSAWGAWSHCTDAGRTRSRVCNNPLPMYGGLDCAGPREETSICYVCSSSLSMHLSPHSFTKHHLGQNVTFECGYCGTPMEKIRIDLDTSPSSRSKGLVHSVSRQTFEGNCSTKLWTVKLSTGVDYVKCSLSDGRMNVLGSLASKLQIIGENETCDAEKEFCCANERCIPQLQRCNGYDDCDDESDEANCRSCSVGAFQCDTRDKCIPDSERCDGEEQCSDGSDERNCDRHNADEDRQIQVESGNLEFPSYGNPWPRPSKHSWM